MKRSFSFNRVVLRHKRGCSRKQRGCFKTQKGASKAQNSSNPEKNTGNKLKKEVATHHTPPGCNNHRI